MAEDILLAVKDLKKHFVLSQGFFRSPARKVYAVDGVSFSLRQGETLGLVGESGCGKSTLGRTILRLYEPDSGSIVFSGQDITHTGMSRLRPLRRDMQIIFQDPFASLNPRMDVRGLLSEPYIIHGEVKKRDMETELAELLETVGLSQDALEKYPHEFSGGQRQRIGIARALSLRPKLIIADEPVSALDVSIQSQILNLLGEMKKKFALSFIFIAHDLSVVEHISDQIAVMYLGRIVEHTKSEELCKRPLHPYTKALFDAVPKPEFDKDAKKKLLQKATLKGDVPSPQDPPSGCHFHPRCPIATALCREKVPALRDLSTGTSSHLVACHHV